ncbi:MAG: sigma-70 family RNA polymerase sigma factor [Flavobacteriales bacterium]|nr:sigma-70 family RNA polymerase sigma factor [Flavobacteriales bacterium]
MELQHEEAVIRAAQADAQRFAPLYDHYFTTIFRFVHRRAGERELSADLTQQTFLKAMLALPKYTFQGLPFRAWLYRIALNELRMHWRKKKEVVMDLGWAEVKPLADECGVAQQEEEMQLIASGLGRLKPEQAQLIELRYFDGLSFAEVGQVLGIGEDAAKMRTHRVLAVLREYLAPTT